MDERRETVLEVVVAIVTFRRPDQLAGAMTGVLAQFDALEQDGPPVSATLLVVDNDPQGSARRVTEACEDPRLRVVDEPTPGVAAARNAALDAAGDADVLVFIDDDERPCPGWLRALLRTRGATGADLVSGPVVSVFDGGLDPWVDAGGFYDREHREGLTTGAPITRAATNNLLLDLRTVRRSGIRFDGRFGLTGGEDSLFTGSLVRAGARAVWCADAVVHDLLPAARMTPEYVVDRTVSLANASARAELALTTDGLPRARRRVTIGAKAIVRWAVGALRSVLGAVSGSRVHGARGARSRARARGELLAVSGRAESPYARSS